MNKYQVTNKIININQLYTHYVAYKHLSCLLNSFKLDKKKQIYSTFTKLPVTTLRIADELLLFY